MAKQVLVSEELYQALLKCEAAIRRAKADRDKRRGNPPKLPPDSNGKVVELHTKRILEGT